MSLEGEDKPNIIVVDAGDVFVGGRYHSLVPILRYTVVFRKRPLFRIYNDLG